MIIKECRYEPHHTHEWPDDWTFGGANGADPRADARYRSTTYQYLDDHLNPIWLTQVPLCDDQAIDEFTKFATGSVMYLQARRPGSDEMELLDWKYEVATDLVVPLGD